MNNRKDYPLDHPNRFYGFDTPEQEQVRALEMINASIATVNRYRPIITRQITSVDDQDTLNYLHSIFERYHGLLDQQDHEFFKSAPDTVKQALADLNINVHRCESVARGSRPRFVCTWYGMPKTKSLTDELLKYGTLNPKFGSVCLNYCEIGKTLEDLTQDRDNYISEEAFQITYGLGIALEIPEGFVGLVFPRSSIRKTDLSLTNCVGVIDSGYRGELQATFRKHKGVVSTKYEVGDRVCQITIIPHPPIEFNEVNELSNTERGEGGFGSTGK
jgi:dUTP pyrophosphatase